jgi:ABC-2 type transport system permease protein
VRAAVSCQTLPRPACSYRLSVGDATINHRLDVRQAGRAVQTVNASFIIFFPLLFLTPNFVPLDLLAGPLRTIARFNPVSYVITGLRDLVLYPDIHWGSLGACVLTIALTGLVLTAVSLRTLNRFA